MHSVNNLSVTDLFNFSCTLPSKGQTSAHVLKAKPSSPALIWVFSAVDSKSLSCPDPDCLQVYIQWLGYFYGWLFVRVGIMILLSHQASKVHSGTCFFGHLKQVIFFIYWLGDRHNIKIKPIVFLTARHSGPAEGVITCKFSARKLELRIYRKSLNTVGNDIYSNFFHVFWSKE